MAADGTSVHNGRRLARPLIEDLAWLAKRMRPCEVTHFLALSGLETYDPDIAARAMAMQAGPAFVLVGANNLPIVAGGFVPERRGVYEAWLLGTLEAWNEHWWQITRVCRRQFDLMFQGGAHRIQIITAPENTKNHEWYVRALGMRREGLLGGYCADGSDMVMFARTA